MTPGFSPGSYLSNNGLTPNYTTSPVGGGFGSGGSIDSDLGNLFGQIMGAENWKNPADAGNSYMNQISPMIDKYLSPFINAGSGQIGPLQQQLSQLLNNPGGTLNSMGAGYQASPGYQWQVGQATGAANRAAAAGGMLGSPQEQQNLAGTVTGLANQDYYNYLDKVMGLYSGGLSGAEGLFNTGAQSAENASTSIGNSLESQAQMAYMGQNAQNQQEGSMWGSIGSIAGDLI